MALTFSWRWRRGGGCPEKRGGMWAKAKTKARDSYIARLTGKPDQPRFTIIGSGSWSARANGAAALMRPPIARANEQLDPRQQLANTPPPQSSTTPGFRPVCIHQMAPPERTSDCSLLLIYRPRKDEANNVRGGRIVGKFFWEGMPEGLSGGFSGEDLSGGTVRGIVGGGKCHGETSEGENCPDLRAWLQFPICSE